MANSRTRVIRYTPKYTQMEAYDLCPPLIQQALQEGAQEWDTGAVLRAYKKEAKLSNPQTAEKLIANRVWYWHKLEIKNGYCWRTRAVGQKWSTVPQSPHNQANATMALGRRPA